MLRSHQIAAQAMKEKVYRGLVKYMKEHGVGPTFVVLARKVGASELLTKSKMAELRHDGRITIAPPHVRYTPESVRITNREDLEQQEETVSDSISVMEKKQKLEEFLGKLDHLIETTGSLPRTSELMKMTGFNQTRISAYLRELRTQGRVAYEDGKYRTLRILKPKTGMVLHQEALRTVLGDDAAKALVPAEAKGEAVVAKLLRLRQDYAAKIEFIDMVMAAE